MYGQTTRHLKIQRLMKAVHVMPALLLRKPSKTSKANHHLKVLERRLRLWEENHRTCERK